MSLRIPDTLTSRLRVETGASVLDAEILAERGAALGRAGDKVEQALAALAEAPEDEPRLKAAAEAVYAYFVLRELNGFLDHTDAVQTYGVPRRVLARLGAR